MVDNNKETNSNKKYNFHRRKEVKIDTKKSASPPPVELRPIVPEGYYRCAYAVACLIVQLPLLTYEFCNEGHSLREYSIHAQHASSDLVISHMYYQSDENFAILKDLRIDLDYLIYGFWLYREVLNVEYGLNNNYLLISESSEHRPSKHIDVLGRFPVRGMHNIRLVDTYNLYSFVRRHESGINMYVFSLAIQHVAEIMELLVVNIGLIIGILLRQAKYLKDLSLLILPLFKME